MFTVQRAARLPVDLDADIERHRARLEAMTAAPATRTLAVVSLLRRGLQAFDADPAPNDRAPRRLHLPSRDAGPAS